MVKVECAQTDACCTCKPHGSPCAAFVELCLRRAHVLTVHSHTPVGLVARASILRCKHAGEHAGRRSCALRSVHVQTRAGRSSRVWSRCKGSGCPAVMAATGHFWLWTRCLKSRTEAFQLQRGEQSSGIGKPRAMTHPFASSSIQHPCLLTCRYARAQSALVQHCGHMSTCR